MIKIYKESSIFVEKKKLRSSFEFYNEISFKRDLLLNI